MTNEQAIEIFKERLDLAERYGYAVELGGYDDAMRMAIEALEVGHAQCNDCHYRYHWMTQRMNGQNGGASA